MELLWQLLVSSWLLAAAMAPYLLLGFLVAGLVSLLLPAAMIIRYLGGESPWAVIRASILGIPLPLCSCGVLPIAVQLRKAGAGKAPTLSFLITTPVTGVDSLLATYSLLGFTIMLARLVCAALIGIVTGLLMTLVELLAPIERPAVSKTPADLEHEVCAEKTCGECPKAEKKKRAISRVIVYAFYELPAAISGPILFGLLLGGALTAFVPPDFIRDHVGTGLAGIALSTVIALPLYVCSSGAIPIAAAMVFKGFSPGAALAFLIASPASNAVGITTVRRVLGNRALLVYLSVILGGAFLSGLVFDWLAFAPGDWSLGLPGDSGHHLHLSLFKTISAVLLLFMLLFHFGRNLAMKYFLSRQKGDLRN